MGKKSEVSLRDSLENHYQTTTIKRMARWAEQDPGNLKQVLDLVMGKDEVLAQRAAWVLGHCHVKQGRQLDREFPRLIKSLRATGLHAAVYRNIFRLLQDYPVPEKYRGSLLDICFQNISNSAVPPAIRTFALSTAATICLNYPELKIELEMIVRELLLYPQPPAILSRSKKVLKQLRS